MKILSRKEEIKDILNNYLTIELIELILKKEKENIEKETIKYYVIHSPIYCGPGWNGYFFSLKKYRNILYDKDFKLMNEIRTIGGSTKKARDFRAERIWGKYLSSLRF